MYNTSRTFVGRRCIKSFDGFVAESRNFDMADGATKWMDLPESVRTDIVENVYDASEYLKREWNIWTFKETLEDDLNPPVLNIERLDVDSLGAGRLSGSDLVVNKYEKLIAGGIDMDPIIVNDGKFYDGRHRLMAYKHSGKKTIPTIDIAPMLGTDWKEYLENNGKGAWES